MHQQSVHAVFGGGELCIVEIVGVNGDTVHKGGKSRGCFLRGADDRGFSARTPRTVQRTCGKSGRSPRVNPPVPGPSPSRMDFLPKFNYVPRECLRISFELQNRPRIW